MRSRDKLLSLYSRHVNAAHGADLPHVVVGDGDAIGGLPGVRPA